MPFMDTPVETIEEIRARDENLKHANGVPITRCPRCHPDLQTAQHAIRDRQWLLEALERARRHESSARYRAQMDREMLLTLVRAVHPMKGDGT